MDARHPTIQSSVFSDVPSQEATTYGGRLHPLRLLYAWNSFCPQQGFPGFVRGEETVIRKIGATRPDISVRDHCEGLLATIECKTNLGWARDSWKQKHETRSANLKALFPECTTFLCVMSRKTGIRQSWKIRHFSGASGSASPKCRLPSYPPRFPTIAFSRQLSRCSFLFLGSFKASR